MDIIREKKETRERRIETRRGRIEVKIGVGMIIRRDGRGERRKGRKKGLWVEEGD